VGDGKGIGSVALPPAEFIAGVVVGLVVVGLLTVALKLSRDQSKELLSNLGDPKLSTTRTFEFVAYILAALRNVGFGDQREREEAAHDVVVQLLVSPGQLFAAYGVTSGPMEARFRLSVQNAVRNLLRSRRRREPMSRAFGIGHGAGELPVHAIPDRRHNDLDEEMLAAFRVYLRDALGEDAVTLLDRRLNGVSLRQLVSDPVFSNFTAWTLRRLMRSVQQAALPFAWRHGDDDFLAAIERTMDG
jgi:hypothetical protein